MTKHQLLKTRFGYDNFRNGQEQLIDDILSKRDVLGIMPTGAGKSVCYQVPALMTDGITLVISPLISLMKDQVTALKQSGVKAAFINSSLSERQIYLALQNARNGAYKLIYIAPERLLTDDFLSFAQSAQIDMLTVDEAHCISQWGQDFRPSYSKIPEFIKALPTRPILSAFTATATLRVREDIISLLKLQDPTVLVTGFDRKNLYFEVQKPKNKFYALDEFLSNKKDKCGIIYCGESGNAPVDAVDTVGFIYVDKQQNRQKYLKTQFVKTRRHLFAHNPGTAEKITQCCKQDDRRNCVQCKNKRFNQHSATYSK